MEQNKKIVLPSKRFKNATENDINQSLLLDNNYKLIRDNERNINIKLSELYDTERNNSDNYKIFGKLKLIYNNNYSGTTNYNYLKNRLYLNGDGTNNIFEGFLPHNEFAFDRDDFLQFKTQYTNNNTITETVNENNHINILSTENNKFNWGLFLTYCYDVDRNYLINFTLNNNLISYTVSDGIPFIVEENNNFYKLKSIVKHNIKQGEYLLINLNNTQYCLYVNYLGDENNLSEEYILNISKTQISMLPSLIFGKRCLDKNNIEETTSEYYVQKLKFITNLNDYDATLINLEKSIWKDEKKIIKNTFLNQKNKLIYKNKYDVSYFDFKKTLKLNDLLNNFNIQPTKVYLSVIFLNKNGLFNYPPKVGFDFNFNDTFLDKCFDDNNSIYENLPIKETTINNISTKSFDNDKFNDFVYGNFIEYNNYELKEYIISESYHKLNISKDIFNFNQNTSTILNNVTDTNTLGFFYKNNYEIKLREESTYIEKSNTNNIINLPKRNTYIKKEKLFYWRDLYPHGYIDEDGNGTNFPFMNNFHYITKNINIYLYNDIEFKNKTITPNNLENTNLFC